MKPILGALYLILWIITAIFTGISGYVIVDSLFLSSHVLTYQAFVDDPDFYILQKVNQERNHRQLNDLHDTFALNQVAHYYTEKYAEAGNAYPIQSVQLVYDLYLQNYFIGEVIHQLHGVIGEPISETTLDQVVERVKTYAMDYLLTDIGLSIFVNGDGSFYYMVLLSSPEKLTSRYANPSYVGGYSQDGQMNAIIAMLNQARTDQGLQPVTPNPYLIQAAYGHSLDMAQRNRLGHDGSDGSTPQMRILNAGYQAISTGENVLVRPNAYAAGAFDQWWNSISHYETMMHPDFREIGVAWGFHAPSGNYYYTMVLGTQ
jgi:uncharacterized protein YkwD